MRGLIAPDSGTAAPVALPASSRPGGTVDSGGRRGPHRALVAFLVTAAVGLVLVSVGSFFVSQRIARAAALDNAERAATRLSADLVGPLLPGALDGRPGPSEELRRKVENRLLDRSVDAVFVWNADGKVLFCSEQSQIGVTTAPTENLLAAVHGHVASEFAPGSELPFARADTGQLIDVYVPISANKQNLVFEAYFDGTAVDRVAGRLRDRIVPLAIVGLCVLQLVQIPVAISLARRARSQDKERAELMALSLEVSERERRAIAADVHRGPVPQLVRISSNLEALKDSLPAERGPLVDRLVEALGSARLALSRLIIDLYPPGPGGPDLVAALENLTVPLREAGVEVIVTSAPLPKLSLETAAAVYRTAKEALTNVGKHAGATHAWVALEPAGDRRAPAVRLCVLDDGVGFPEDARDRRSDGHLGLRLLADRVEDAGGALELGERPGGGASVIALFPAVPGT